jgi:hypothetical protein
MCEVRRKRDHPVGVLAWRVRIGVSQIEVLGIHIKDNAENAVIDELKEQAFCQVRLS